MIILYETCGWPFSKMLYDDEKHCALGQYEHYKLGWIWTEDFKELERGPEEQWEYVLSEMQRSKIGKNYTKATYETFEDFLLDKI